MFHPCAFSTFAIDIAVVEGPPGLFIKREMMAGSSLKRL